MQNAPWALPPAQPEPAKDIVWDSISKDIKAQIEDGGGFWRSCSGCHELSEGHDTGLYSDVFKCALGLGCAECGGIGAIWDSLDYSAVNEPEPAPTREEIAKIIRDQLLTLDLGCGEDVNIHDALAAFRNDHDVGNAKELISEVSMWAADAILALRQEPATAVEPDANWQAQTGLPMEPGK